MTGARLPVERRDAEKEPVPERGPVPGCGVTERQGHRVRARPVVMPTAKPFEPGEFGLPRPARLQGGLVGENLARGRVDAPLAQRGRDSGLLEGSVGQVAIFCRSRFKDVRQNPNKCCKQKIYGTLRLQSDSLPLLDIPVIIGASFRGNSS